MRSDFAATVQVGTDKSEMVMTKAASPAALASHRHLTQAGRLLRIASRNRRSAFVHRPLFRGISVAPLSYGRRLLR
jgi:hypothetical protein